MSDTTTGFLPTQTLAIPEMDMEDEVGIRETIWWHLQPGEPGYDQPLFEFCGFTEEEWLARRLKRGWR